MLESTLQHVLMEAQREVVTVATEIDPQAMQPAQANRYRPQIGSDGRRRQGSSDLRVGGSLIDLVRFFSLFDKAPGTFAIVTP